MSESDLGAEKRRLHKLMREHPDMLGGFAMERLAAIELEEKMEPLAVLGKQIMHKLEAIERIIQHFSYDSFAVMTQELNEIRKRYNDVAKMWGTDRDEFVRNAHVVYLKIKEAIREEDPQKTRHFLQILSVHTGHFREHVKNVVLYGQRAYKLLDDMVQLFDHGIPDLKYPLHNPKNAFRD